MSCTIISVLEEDCNTYVNIITKGGNGFMKVAILFHFFIKKLEYRNTINAACTLH